MPSGPKTLNGTIACWTGFRDTDAEAYVTSHGGRVAGMSSKVTVLFAASTGSTKCNKADSLGIEIVPQKEMWQWLKARGKD